MKTTNCTIRTQSGNISAIAGNLLTGSTFSDTCSDAGQRGKIIGKLDLRQLWDFKTTFFSKRFGEEYGIIDNKEIALFAVVRKYKGRYYLVVDSDFQFALVLKPS